MKKILFAALAATTVIASASTVSAQTRNWDVSAATPMQTGGGSIGYNWNVVSPDAGY